jgi:zinc D-Ala-D-Ala carboxypeptidase
MNWDKYKPFFQPSEFVCKCGCGLILPVETHMDMLLEARRLAGIPFLIVSGTRCPVHNARSGGKPGSDHLTGQGTDIRVLASDTRLRIVRALIEAGFRRIGIAGTFIHAGSDNRNPQNVMFLY